MKRKRLLAAGLCLALVAAVSVAGTLAYFSDSSDAKSNTFTMGHVDIEVVDEPHNLGDTFTDDEGKTHRVVHGTDTPAPGPDGLTYENVMPGDIIDKTVGVTLKAGSMDAWLAIKVTVVPTLPAGSSLVAGDVANEILGLIDKEVTGEWDKAAVLDKDGQPVPGSAVYYYNAPVAAVNAEGKPADVSQTLFAKLELPGAKWDNAYAGLGFNIVVEAAAVQEDNVTLEKFKSMAWSGFEEYTHTDTGAGDGTEAQP